MSDLLDIRQAAAALGISPEKLRQMSNAGAVAFIHVSGTKRKTRMFEPSAIERFIDSRRRDVTVHREMRASRQAYEVPQVF